MAKEIKMPQLSDTMSEGKILDWKVNVGSVVSRGTILAEVETDKANLEIECFEHGVVLAINIAKGENAKVGEVIAVIGSAEENVKQDKDQNLIERSNQSNNILSSNLENLDNPNLETVNVPKVNKSASSEFNTARDLLNNDSRIKISPLAKKFALEKNIDITLVNGSGPDGRIIKKDLEYIEVDKKSYFAEPTQQSNVIVFQNRDSSTLEKQNFETQTRNQQISTPKTSQKPIENHPSSNSGLIKPMSKMRETIARRMKESVHTHPHFFSVASINMDKLVSLKDLIKSDAKLNVKFSGVSINHFIIKACAVSLKQHPLINCCVKDENNIYDPEVINIGIVTALEDGLMIPVIKNTDKLSLKDLAFEAKAAVERARSGRPTSADLSGGTFSISNLGMFDVENFSAIINPGQGAILAVGAIKDTPIVDKNGNIVVAKIMKVTLSCDHRIIDGITAAQFMKTLTHYLEEPILLDL